MPIQKSILIDVDFDILMQRLTGRLTCEDCGEVFNIFTNPPALDEECDQCGSKLHHRSDDNEETIGKRLRVYETQTLPVVEFYKSQGKLSVVEGKGEIKDIFSALQIALKSARPSTSLNISAATKPVTEVSQKTNEASSVTTKATPTPAPAPTSAPPAISPIIEKPAAEKIPAVNTDAETTNTPKPASKPASSLKKKASNKKTATRKSAVKKKTTAKAGTSSPTTKKKAIAKKVKPVVKPTSKKKSVAKKQPLKPIDAREELKQLKTELKAILIEINQTEKRNATLIKIELGKDLIRKQYSAKLQNEMKKMLKNIK